MNNRILYVDYMKAVAMILVIMGHVNFANEPVKAWIYSFHMPAFFFCTGLVLKMGGKISLKDTLQNKLHRLMLPYLLWALLYAKFTVPNFLKIVYGSYWSIASSGSSSNLWFLPVMFVALVFFYLFVKTGLATKKVAKILLMLISFAIACLLPHLKFGYPWGADVAFMAFAFILLGSISHEYIGRLYQYSKSHISLGLAISFILFVLLFAGTLTYHLNNPSGGWVMMKNAHYGHWGFFALTAICGTMMLLFLSVFIELMNMGGYKWLSFVGQNTLVIFVVHKPIIAFFRALFRYAQVSEVVMLFVTTVGTLLLSCLLCVLIIKFVPVLAGK